jgi:hypothetical protein
MKVAVLSANFGNFDKPNNFPKQTIDCDRLVFDESNTPYPLSALSPRMKGKFFKMQAHKFLPEYDIFVWLDSNVKVLSSDMVSHMIEPLTDNQVSIQKHPHRSSIYEELEYMEGLMIKGSKYLNSRYQLDALKAEVKDIGEGYSNLYACNIFARLNSPAVNEMFDYWWEQQFLFNDFDQIRFVEVATSLKVGVLEFGNFYKNKYYELIPHNK